MLLYCWEEGSKGKTPFLFPQKNFNLVTCSHRGPGDGTEMYQLGLNELQVPEKTNPTGFIKGNFRFPSRKVQGSLATGIAGSRASGIGADLLSLHSTLFPITLLLSSACLYNGCLHLQARILSDCCLLVKQLIWLQQLTKTTFVLIFVGLNWIMRSSGSCTDWLRPGPRGCPRVGVGAHPVKHKD